MPKWHNFAAEEKNKQLDKIIKEENLKDNETFHFMDCSVKTTGTDIDRIMQLISRFGSVNRIKKK